jgi:hypothetical protein
MRHRVLATTALAVVALLPVTALASAPPGESTQEVSGTVAVPNPTKGAPVVVTRHARSAGLLDEGTNGLFGWFFEVDPETWGGQFSLTTTTAGADLDILFYADPGTLADAPTATAEYEGSDGDGERGIVPPQTTHALIYPAGAPNADFTYTGHAPVEVEIGAGSLDVTVPLGAAVVWRNATEEPTVVDGGRSFGSATALVAPGETFRATFNRTGSFPYTTAVGTGTVTVVLG